MEKIEAPDTFTNPKSKGAKRNWKKIIAILVIITIPTAIATPYVIDLLATTEDETLTFGSLSLQAYHNDSDTVSIGLSFAYQNEYEKDLTLDKYEVTLYMKNKSAVEWQKVTDMTGSISKSIPVSGKIDITAIFNMSNSVSDSLKRLFMGEIIKKSDFSFRIKGNLHTALLSDATIPDKIALDISVIAKDYFKYEIPDNGVTILTLKDLITNPPNPLFPNKFNTGLISEYENPLPFPINFTSLSAKIFNRTLDGQLGSFSWDQTKLGNFGSLSKKNISETLYLSFDDIASLVEDLLSGITDVIKLKDVSGIVYIGDVAISISRSVETVASDLEFKLEISKYGAGPNGKLLIEATIVNPCNLIFNVSYIDIRMYPTGTLQQLLYLSQSVNVTIFQYRSNVIKDLLVDVSYTSFLAHIDDTFTLIGYLVAQSYNYNGTINFNAKDVELLT
jgi:hypothetical protein